MDFKKIFIKNACPTNVGGQAVLEGIMMKGNDRTAVVVRLPDDSMYIHTEKLASRGKAYKIPIVRGVMIFVNSLVTGIRTLMLSAELLEKGGYFDEDEDAAQADGSAELNESAGSDYTETVMESHEAHGSDYTETVMESHETHGSDYTETVTAPHEAHGSDYTEAVMASHEARESNASEAKESAEGGRFTRWLEARFGEKAPLTLTLISAVVISLAFTIGVFIIAPTWIVDFFGIWVKNKIALNLIEGVFRILLFVLYILLVSRMKDIKMVFQFHGAEHQCIHCYEGGKELTPENCEDYETLHPRCGTSFLMFVMVIALLLFSLLGWPNLIIRITSRLILVPVIAGLSYELLRWAGSADNIVVKILSVPGLLLQRITTLKPNRTQLAVAIAAMKAVLVPAETPEIDGPCDGNGELIPEERNDSGTSDQGNYCCS